MSALPSLDALAFETPRVSEAEPLTELDRNLDALSGLAHQARHYDHSVPPSSYARLFRPRDIGWELTTLVGEGFLVQKIPVWHAGDHLGMPHEIKYQITCPEFVDPMRKAALQRLFSFFNKAAGGVPLQHKLEMALGELMFVGQKKGNSVVLDISERDAERVLNSPSWIGKVQSLLTSYRTGCDTDAKPRLPWLMPTPMGRSEYGL